MSTVILPVQEQRFNRATIEGKGARDSHDTQTVVRLSPFNMPRAMEIEVDSNDFCTLRFLYPVEEDPLRETFSLGAHEDFEIVLGQSSRKVLTIRIANATEHLKDGPFRIPLEGGARLWSRALPEHAQFACKRNASVIEEFLGEMPDKAREDLLKALAQLKEIAREKRATR